MSDRNRTVSIEIMGKYHAVRQMYGSTRQCMLVHGSEMVMHGSGTVMRGSDTVMRVSYGKRERDVYETGGTQQSSGFHGPLFHPNRLTTNPRHSVY